MPAIVVSMRITGGKYCGRHLACPKGVIRPAMDRMRESMFAVLEDLNDLSFLDMFAGSGIVGAEAAARGASPVVFVEKDRGKIGVLKKNLSFIEEETVVRNMDVFRFLKTWRDSFDIIYLDPPFAFSNKEKIIQAVENSGILKARGTLLLHHPKGDSFSDAVGSITLKRVKTYGGSIVRFYGRDDTTID